MRRALQRAFSGAPLPPPPVARPRAVTSWGVQGKHGKHIYRYAALGGSLLVAGYVAYLNDFDVRHMALKVQEGWSNMLEPTAGDPKPEDLQKALGDKPDAHFLNLIIAVEDVLLLREWDVRGAPCALLLPTSHSPFAPATPPAPHTLFPLHTHHPLPLASTFSPSAATATPCTPVRAC
jgi:hypothetical protein